MYLLSHQSPPKTKALSIIFEIAGAILQITILVNGGIRVQVIRSKIGMTPYTKLYEIRSTISYTFGVRVKEFWFGDEV